MILKTFATKDIDAGGGKMVTVNATIEREEIGAAYVRMIGTFKEKRVEKRVTFGAVGGVDDLHGKSAAYIAAHVTTLIAAMQDDVIEELAHQIKIDAALDSIV